MQLGDRIERRLAVLEISQSELARRTDIPQTTIKSLIRKGRRSSPHLLKIARGLETTPAYLVGEVDDPEAEGPDGPDLNYEQLELVDCFDRMERANQLALLQMARALAEKRPTPRERMHDKPVGFRAQSDSD